MLSQQLTYLRSVKNAAVLNATPPTAATALDEAPAMGATPQAFRLLQEVLCLRRAEDETFSRKKCFFFPKVCDRKNERELQLCCCETSSLSLFPVSVNSAIRSVFLFPSSSPVFLPSRPRSQG